MTCGPTVRLGRTGPSDANNLRSLKKLADRLDDAANQGDRAIADLNETTRNLQEARAEVERTRAIAHAAARSLGLDLSKSPTTDAAEGLIDEDADKRLLRAIRRAVAAPRHPLHRDDAPEATHTPPTAIRSVNAYRPATVHKGA